MKTVVSWFQQFVPKHQYDYETAPKPKGWETSWSSTIKPWWSIPIWPSSIDLYKIYILVIFLPGSVLPVSWKCSNVELSTLSLFLFTGRVRRTSWKGVNPSFFQKTKKQKTFCILATFYCVKCFDKMLFFFLFGGVVQVVTVSQGISKSTLYVYECVCERVDVKTVFCQTGKFRL